MAKNYFTGMLSSAGAAMQAFGRELRNSLESPQTPLSYPAEWLLDLFNGGRTDSGIRVSEMSALQTSAVLACVNLISNGVAATPLHVVMRESVNGRTKTTVAHDNPLYDILHDEPNPEMTAPTWRKTMQAHALLWGNGYSEIERDNANRIVNIWPRNPARTRAVRLTEAVTVEGTLFKQGTMVYETYDPIGDTQILNSDNKDNQYGYRRIVLAEDMLHIPGLALDGRVGQDIVWLSRQAIGMALATEKYGAKFFGNGAIPAGILETGAGLTDVQMETMRRSWVEQQGGENAHKTGVLPPGVKYTKTGANPNEGQFIETRQFQRGEIASIFLVPPHMIGAKDASGKSSVEQSAIEFFLYCLQPWLVQWEKELRRKLFSNLGRSAGKFRARFDTRQLLYPDAESRSKFYSTGRQWGYLNANDCREMENLNPIEDKSGDSYWMPINMQDAEMAVTHASQVTTNLKNGSLQAVPTNAPTAVQPTGTHPIKVDEKKEKAADRKASQFATMVNAKATVAAAKHTGNAAAGAAKQGSGQQGPTPGKKPSKKRSAIVDIELRQAEFFIEGEEEVDLSFYEPFMRDAVGRAAFRKKPAPADYATIFSPVILSMAEAVHDEPVDVRQFVDQYAHDLMLRYADGWGEKLDEIAKAETELVLDALKRA